jgi:peroxiredoxin
MTFRRLAYLASVAGLCAMSGGMTVSALPKGNDAPLTFRLRDSAGIQHSDLELRPARAVVLLFITPDCPISQGYVPEMNRIANEFRAKGVTVFGVQADVTARLVDVQSHVREYSYAFPVLIDDRQLLVKRTNATTTPESVVMTPDGAVVYQGRIDNRVAGLGTRRVQATEFDLRNALDAVLAGRPVARPRTTAYGCLISRTS